MRTLILYLEELDPSARRFAAVQVSRPLEQLKKSFIGLERELIAEVAYLEAELEQKLRHQLDVIGEIPELKDA